jgi:hypothetical protein
MKTRSDFAMNFDPSKMDPKLLMEMSQLIQQLPPDQLNRMQTLMHNMMAGFDVRAEMEAFESSLPPGFREKLVSILGTQGFAPPSSSQSEIPPKNPQNVDEARLTVLWAVAEKRVTPEEALKMLFPS